MTLNNTVDKIDVSPKKQNFDFGTLKKQMNADKKSKSKNRKNLSH